MESPTINRKRFTRCIVASTMELVTPCYTTDSTGCNTDSLQCYTEYCTTLQTVQ